ncbi:MAG: ATPase subunit of ABC transporter with duplicated ATPase domains [Myxococcota bacterium]|jgi:ATPase subunit of ABC transporter with duplicated ATPase domains
MIVVSDVSKGFAGRTLFRDVNVTFSAGRNYGLSGPNGAGKTTFMRILIGDEPADKGNVTLPERTGWLRQDQSAFDDKSVLEAVIMGNKRLAAARAEQEVLYAKEDFTDDDGMRLADLESIVAEENGYTAESDAAVLLAGLGVSEEEHARSMGEIQGGIKVRVLLAQALFGEPEALLLDEPTNALDMESIIWLEDFLIRYDGALLVISHDRRFLNTVCDHIADIDYETIITYTGNYDDMVRTKAGMRGQVERDKAQREKKIAQLKDFIQRFGAGTRASQTRSRARQITKLRPDEVKRSNIARPFIRFDVGEENSGRDPIEVRDLSHAYGDHVVFSGFNTMVQRGDKIAVVGRNGIGKSTLMRALLNPDNEKAGHVKWGHNVRVGSMGHDHREQIEDGTEVFKWLFSQKYDADENTVRAILGRMLFSGEDGFKPTTTLSGGEGARLVISKLILLQHNVLLLDEPTDHLDLEAVSALRDAIAAFQGTVIYVTHDRDLASVANRIWTYPRTGELIDFDGGLEAYLAWFEAHYRQTA